MRVKKKTYQYFGKQEVDYITQRWKKILETSSSEEQKNFSKQSSAAEISSNK